MVMLCFVMDLRSLSPPVLRDLKQSLLQLANYYAISSPKNSNGCDSTQSSPLLDRIGLCYVFRDRVSCTDEVKIAYNPQGNFNLRDFHHALNNIPTNVFSPEFNNFGGLYLKLVDVLSDKIVYAWGVHDKNVARKVILISDCVVDTVTLDSGMVKTLMDATDKHVLVEFVFLEQASSCLGDMAMDINQFAEQINCLPNCCFRKYVPDVHVFSALMKRWFLELKDDKEKSMEARFIFKINLNSTVNKICCELYSSYNPIIDGFTYCQTCRCHGTPLDVKKMKQKKSSSSCPVTKDFIGDLDIVDNSVSIGEQTILYMPSFRGGQKVQQVTSIIDFNVIRRTNLGSLNEGLIMGASYYVTPSTSHNSDENHESERNNQLFQVVCNVLNANDWGLVCSSNCNIETSMETSFKCYYILLPSDRGLMLLRRLSAAEEFMPIPDSKKFNSFLAKNIERAEIEKNTLQALQKQSGNCSNKLTANGSQLHDKNIKIKKIKTFKLDIKKHPNFGGKMIELSDYYNPFQHERGFHQKLNLLVKESLQFGAILPQRKEGSSESDPATENYSSEPSQPEQLVDIIVSGEKILPVDIEAGEDKAKPCETEEWEQLIVTEFGSLNSPIITSTLKLDQLVTSQSQSNNKQLDEKTSRILERLEGPRQVKRKSGSPTISGSIAVTDVFGLVKKPLIPYESIRAADQGRTSSQPIKPNFLRIKKKK